MWIQYMMSGTRSTDGAKVVLWRHQHYQYSIEIGAQEKTKHYFQAEYYDAVEKYNKVLSGVPFEETSGGEDSGGPEITMTRGQLDKLNEFADHFSDVDKFRLSADNDKVIVSFNL